GPVEAESGNVAGDEIGKEILPLQGFARAAINIAARDRRAASTVGVEKDRRGGGSSGRRASADLLRSFENWPAVVGAELPAVDLPPPVSADIGDIEVAERAVEARPPRIAQPDGKDLVPASGGSCVGIVRRDRVVLCGIGERITVDVDAEDVAEQIIDRLASGGDAIPLG